MKVIFGTLALMAAVALADTPSAPATSVSSNPIAAPATPSSTSASSSAPPTSTTHEAVPVVDPREAFLRTRGYRMETRNGEKLYCHTEEVLGSRLGGKRICGTVNQLLDREQMSKDMLESAQRRQENPIRK